MTGWANQTHDILPHRLLFLKWSHSDHQLFADKRRNSSGLQNQPLSTAKAGPIKKPPDSDKRGAQTAHRSGRAFYTRAAALQKTDGRRRGQAPGIDA
ncbi:hypothetical protein, partial [Candidatus Pseudoscillospira sp. SGI.172]|uniref:hypothetical protein n=1 Tax=Candidatus Pseudoscillospira sp. SGI.172 TaxID=3420582 RepID=UPI003D058EC6